MSIHLPYTSPLPHQHCHYMPLQHLQNQSGAYKMSFSCRVGDNLLNFHSTCPHCSTPESNSCCFIAASFCFGTPVSKDWVIHISACSLLLPSPTFTGSQLSPVSISDNWQVMSFLICCTWVSKYTIVPAVLKNEVIIAVDTKLWLRERVIVHRYTILMDLGWVNKWVIHLTSKLQHLVTDN
jgi:hypothetical protein